MFRTKGSDLGQSVVEYALMAALLGMASITGVTFLVNSMGSSIPPLLDKIFGGAPIVATTAPTDDPTPTADPLPATNLAPNTIMFTPNPLNPSLSTLTVTTSNGIPITVANYPTDIGNTIETSGANGTTEMLLANLESVVQQLLDAGEITPVQASNLTALANQGHKIATVQQIIGDHVSNAISSSSPNELLSTYYLDPTCNCNRLIGGMAYTIGVDVGNGAAINPGDNIATDYLMSNAQVNLSGDNLIQFGQLYQQATANGALNDPTVREIVGGLASAIVAVSESVHLSTNSLLSAVSQTQLIPSGNFDTSVAANFTNYNSAGICNTGGGTDSGVKCQ